MKTPRAKALGFMLMKMIILRCPSGAIHPQAEAWGLLAFSIKAIYDFNRDNGFIVDKPAWITCFESQFYQIVSRKQNNAYFRRLTNPRHEFKYKLIALRVAVVCFSCRRS